MPYRDFPTTISMNSAGQVAALVTNQDSTSSIVRLNDGGAVESDQYFMTSKELQPEVMRLNVGDDQPQFGLRLRCSWCSTSGTAVRRKPGACRVNASGRSSRISASASVYTRLAPHDLQKVVNLLDGKPGGDAR